MWNISSYPIRKDGRAEDKCTTQSTVPLIQSDTAQANTQPTPLCSPILSANSPKWHKIQAAKKQKQITDWSNVSATQAALPAPPKKLPQKKTKCREWNTLKSYAKQEHVICVPAGTSKQLLIEPFANMVEFSDVTMHQWHPLTGPESNTSGVPKVPFKCQLGY